jgi:putative SOS response-associated peptidase YedK
MCGRFVQKSPASEIAGTFGTTGPLPNVQARYNAAPSQDIAVVRRHPETGERTLDLLTWGLVPFWAEDRKIAWKTINARAETVATAPAFKAAFQKRRCLIPADAFYEWTGEKGAKQPHAIAMKDRHMFAFAGLWENWKDPATDLWLRTFTIITTTANEAISDLHDRMPVILPISAHEEWLTANTDVRWLLRPYPAEKMEHWMVDKRVNGPKFDYAEMLNSL